MLRSEWGPERTELKARYETLDVDLRLGRRAMSLDPRARHVTLEDGERVPFDSLVIATGAAARNLPGGERLAGVHTLRTLDDAIAIRDALQIRSPSSKAPLPTAISSPSMVAQASSVGCSP